MSFPSHQFYSGRLSVGSDLQTYRSQLDFWPSGADKPIVFIHIEGVEQTLTPLTDDDADESEMSKTNIDEVLLVVSHLLTLTFLMSMTHWQHKYTPYCLSAMFLFIFSARNFSDAHGMKNQCQESDVSLWCRFLHHVTCALGH